MFSGITIAISAAQTWNNIIISPFSELFRIERISDQLSSQHNCVQFSFTDGIIRRFRVRNAANQAHRFI